MSLKLLADRVGISEMAVRHWESGRSFPSKSKASLVEEALGFRLDWSEGASHVGAGKTAAAMFDQSDLELMMRISRLPMRAKLAIAEFARILEESASGASDAESSLSTVTKAPKVRAPISE